MDNITLALAKAYVDSKMLDVSGANGLSLSVKNLLITILKAGVYTSDQSANIGALEIALNECYTPGQPDSGNGGDPSGDSSETIEESLEPIWINEIYPDITTFAYTEKVTDLPASQVYVTNVLFQPSTLGGGVLHVNLDNTKISKISILVYIFDSNNQPYQLLKFANNVQGDITSQGFVNAGTTPGWTSLIGSASLQIPDGCNAMVVVKITNGTIVDTDNYPKHYDIVDAIKAGEIVTVKVVKEG